MKSCAIHKEKTMYQNDSFKVIWCSVCGAYYTKSQWHVTDWILPTRYMTSKRYGELKDQVLNAIEQLDQEKFSTPDILRVMHEDDPEADRKAIQSVLTRLRTKDKVITRIQIGRGSRKTIYKRI